ncbi:MAG: IS630 family transposase [Cyclobacteriaceae bacterium]|nr:IS630 family transposase [Cyclobacteriaceae bacterium]MCK5371306.1 IS630 family transposase [Cyclobacteriaceae bacterium]
MVVSCQQVREYIENEYGEVYTLSGVNKLLYRLGYSFKQLSLYPSKLDVIKQEDFLTYYRSLEDNLTEHEEIMFMDGVHPQHNTSASRVWSKRGEKKFIPSNSGRQRINLNGLYNPHNQDVIIREDESINAQSTIALLKMAIKKYKDKTHIYCISDNARYYKCKLVNEFLEEHKEKISLIFLPPYSPNLNLIERLWKFLRKKTIHTHYYEKFADFRKAIFEQINDFENQKEELKTFIGREFQLFKIGNLNFR